MGDHRTESHGSGTQFWGHWFWLIKVSSAKNKDLAETQEIQN